MPDKNKIAIIGSGISGMAAAYLLHPHHHVTLYEKNATPGGHARTRTVKYNGTEVAVDTGFIVFNEINYPELVGLFKHLQVPTHKSDMTFSFSQNGGAFEWGAKDLNAIFGQRSNLIKPYFWRMIRDVARFFKHAPTSLLHEEEMALIELLRDLKLGEDFTQRFILPIGAAIWSCPTDVMLDFPAKTFVQFFKNHGLLSFTGQHQWFTVTGGSQEYVKKITKDLNVKTSSAVTRVFPADGKWVVQTAHDSIMYDQVIFASHADETLALLDATPQERAILSTFRYQKNHAVLHGDARVMPRRKACWASWNYTADGPQNNQSLALTYWMNLLQGIPDEMPLFVTLNPTRPIAPEKIFDEHDFSHPVFTREAIEAQAKIPAIQGIRGLWFCGAWQRYGFHEDGLMSAIAVARKMGVKAPWH